jgi:hypothetical protein
LELHRSDFEKGNRELQRVQAELNEYKNNNENKLNMLRDDADKNFT